MGENDLTTSDIDYRVDLLTELLQCNGRMYISKYNSEGTLLASNSPSIFDTLLRSSGLLNEALLFYEKSQKPLVLTNVIGMMWSVIYHRSDEEQTLFLYVMGPVFSSGFSEKSLMNFYAFRATKDSWKVKLIEYLKSVPTLSATDFFKYTLMLHRSVNNEYLKPSDIIFSNLKKDETAASETREIDYADYWNKENTIINFVRTGDIYYKSKIPSASFSLQNIHPATERDLERIRQYTIAFIGQCVRAAIDGGLSPDTAFGRGNVYMNNLATSKTFAELMSVCHSGFEDFLNSVHDAKKMPEHSDAIKACIAYIKSHPDEPLGIEYLAEKIGYSKYYLSKKFKAEVGMSVNSYIKKTRIEKAAYLLVSDKMDIQDISDLLHFGNRNFFTKVFKEETGMNPAAYRNSHRKRL
ncbi:MAG: AraC family transcriptional regulator [Lachnospiraceae bacterium]|jgi:AraC-like DNA-binding protein|nr:AraC family transcriptional regulator [Lachnospiraceae bacterium]MCH4030089.1 AraC family transcriptional regulator [Lachnospiraceae bacterium]MCH4070257.1 AraC family transcriptional regulator [Lachnospiraceae bacterium]MCH4107763.1 AraC family transcriptional regulator [Lachnospiraceae bacterium]MCI1301386.1 AraC family transcriptional regulator [Lachnospiraceae bacterium]